MEVSTVSPPPASPTEGDDLCMMDVTDVSMHSVTLLICLCGLAGNGAVMSLIIMNDITVLIFHLAMTDFLFLLFAVPSSLLFLLEDVSCSPIMPPVYVRFLFQLSVVPCYWGLFRLAFITIMLDMDKLSLLCCHSGLSLRLLRGVKSVLYWAFLTVFTVIPTVTLLCQSHQQQHCRAALISIFTITLLLFAAPMVITRTIDFIMAKCGSKKQEPKRRDVVIFFVVLFSLPLILWNFLQQLGYMVVSSQVFFLLTCIHSSIKPFIYFLAGRFWWPCFMRSLRESLQRVSEEPEEKTPINNDATMDTVV